MTCDLSVNVVGSVERRLDVQSDPRRWSEARAMNRLPLSSIRQRRIPISGMAWSFPRRLVSLQMVSTSSTIVLVLIGLEFPFQ